MVLTLLDKIFGEYKKTVNMSFSELKTWSKTDISRKSGFSRSPVVRNLELLKLSKFKWGNKQIKWAIRTIKFVRNTKRKLKGKVVSHGLSRRDIVLKNWGYNVNKRRRK